MNSPILPLISDDTMEMLTLMGYLSNPTSPSDYNTREMTANVVASVFALMRKMSDEGFEVHTSRVDAANAFWFLAPWRLDDKISSNFTDLGTCLYFAVSEYARVVQARYRGVSAPR